MVFRVSPRKCKNVRNTIETMAEPGRMKALSHQRIIQYFRQYVNTWHTHVQYYSQYTRWYIIDCERWANESHTSKQFLILFVCSEKVKIRLLFMSIFFFKKRHTCGHPPLTSLPSLTFSKHGDRTVRPLWQKYSFFRLTSLSRKPFPRLIIVNDS